MKKLLSIFSSFGITMSSTLSIISCGTTDEQKAKDELNVLKDVKLEINLAGIDANKVIAEIVKLADYTKTVNGTDIKLNGNLKLTKDGKDGVKVADLAEGNTINVSGTIVHAKKTEIKADFKFTIKLVAKKAYTKAKLAGLNNAVNVESTKKVADFKSGLITALQGKTEFNTLADADIDFTKKDGNALEDNDLVAGNIEIKVTAKGNNFEGNKDITVTWTEKKS